VPSRFKIDESKNNTSFLWKYEQKWIAWAVPRVPLFLNGQNLTWATLFWAFLIIICGYLTRYDIHWIWGVSASIVGQYITDSLDGAVGRFRGSGQIYWGHYVDHLLDFIFLCSTIFSYALIVPDQTLILIGLLAIFGSHYASSFLLFGLSRRFWMSASGVSMNELKIGLLILNYLIIIFGTAYLKYLFIVLAVAALIALIVVIYKSQKEAINLDKFANNH
jgi:hypothetical protein